jgi:hypothetical protein
MSLTPIFGDFRIGATGFPTHLPHRDRHVVRGMSPEPEQGGDGRNPFSPEFTFWKKQRTFSKTDSLKDFFARI